MSKQDAPNDLRAQGLSQFAPYLMNRIMHRYNQSLLNEAAPLRLSVPKIRALVALAAHGELTVNALAIFAVAEQSTMSRTVDQMEKDGFIKRAVSKEDSRARVVSLTAALTAAYHDIWPMMEAAESEMLQGLDAADRAQFLKALNQILSNIRINDI